MTYKLQFRKSALKQITHLSKTDQKRIYLAFQKLEKDLFSKNLDIKKLRGTKTSYRLRVGNVRAIFIPSPRIKKIFIWEVGYRGNVY